MPLPPFHADDKETSDEMLRQAENMLNAQLSISLAADQRAYSFANVLAAGATIIAAGGGAAFFGIPYKPLAIVLFLTAAGLLASLLMVILSAKPETFWVSGNSPEEWRQDICDNKTFDDCRDEILSDFADRIERNNAILRRNGDQIHNAIIVAWMSLLGGLLMSCVLILPH